MHSYSIEVLKLDIEKLRDECLHSKATANAMSFGFNDKEYLYENANADDIGYKPHVQQPQHFSIPGDVPETVGDHHLY
jgi:hypothetical protein